MDEKTKALVEKMLAARGTEFGVPELVEFGDDEVVEICAHLRAQAEEIERLKNENLRWQESRDIFVAKAEAAEARLAALTTAEGCDVEGALDAYMDAPNKGLPYDSLVQQRMSAALAVGCAPLRAKVEKMEAVVKAACEYEAYPSERALDELETRVIEYTRHAAPKEPANG